jgi:hypothetical protein
MRRPDHEVGAPLERKSTRGAIRLRRRGTAILIAMEGHLTAEDGRFIAQWLAEVVPTGVRAIFFDAGKLRSYASDVRTLSQRVLREHEDCWTCVHVLVGSRVVAMGAAVANVALRGRLRAYSDRAAFEHALAAEGC